MERDATAARAAGVPAAAGASGMKMVVTMGTLGLVCGVLIVTAFQLTLPAIERNKAAALERAVFDVIPGATTKRVFIERDGRLVPAGESSGGLRYYAGYDDESRLVGVAIEASGQGFADVLRVIYGYAPSQDAVVGLKVLESHETPGLGTKIETDPVFLENFKALDVTVENGRIRNPITLAKRGEKTHPWEVEAITGATISSRAVAGILETSTGRMVPVIVDNLEALEEGEP